MSHAIAQMTDGRDAFAYAGAPGWHGLGQKVTQGASIEIWAREAGMDYTVQSVPLYYRPECDRPAPGQPAPRARVIDDKVAQVRSDTGQALGIVGARFKTVQPIEVLEFFREWADLNAAQIETAGVLHGGRLYFALARIGEAVDIGGGDILKPYVYLSTACDGTRATEERNIATRVVCANTDAMARSEGAAVRKTSHKSIWDAVAARGRTEAALAEFGAYCTMARDLRKVKLGVVKASELTEALVGPAKTEAGRQSQAFAGIMALFQGAALGSDLPGCDGTAWQWLNAVTEHVDHKVRATSDDNRTVSAMFGPGDALKAKARDLLLTLA